MDEGRKKGKNKRKEAGKENMAKRKSQPIHIHPRTLTNAIDNQTKIVTKGIISQF